MYNKVEICGVNTTKLPTLSDEEKKELLEKVSVGDVKAREQLIDGNLRLVLSIVGRFTGRGENPDDLFQVGCIGLIKAIDNFDVNLEVKFSTYAVPMIIGEIRRYLRDNSSVRISRSTRDLAYKALTVREALSRQNATEPTIEDIIRELEKAGEFHTKEEIVCAMEAIIAPISLYEPVYTDGGSTTDALYFMDQLSDPTESDEGWLESIAISEAMKRLSDREQKIIRMRFYAGKTQMQIAEEIGISQAQVSRLEKGALEQIKKQL
jgi:RNA polymerase sporulation-specific sigma factor